MIARVTMATPATQVTPNATAQARCPRRCCATQCLVGRALVAETTPCSSNTAVAFLGARACGIRATGKALGARSRHHRKGNCLACSISAKHGVWHTLSPPPPRTWRAPSARGNALCALERTRLARSVGTRKRALRAPGNVRCALEGTRLARSIAARERDWRVPSPRGDALGDLACGAPWSHGNAPSMNHHHDRGNAPASLPCLARSVAKIGAHAGTRVAQSAAARERAWNMTARFGKWRAPSPRRNTLIMFRHCAGPCLAPSLLKRARLRGAVLRRSADGRSPQRSVTRNQSTVSSRFASEVLQITSRVHKHIQGACSTKMVNM